MKSAYSIIINKHTIIVWFFNEPVLKTKITIMAIGTREYQMWKPKFLFTMQWITQMFWGFCRSHRCMFWQTAKRLESNGAFLAGQPHSETYKKKYKKKYRYVYNIWCKNYQFYMNNWTTVLFGVPAWWKQIVNMNGFFPLYPVLKLCCSVGPLG